MTYRKLFIPAFALIFALASLAHAQFGSGIVYDPTQSAHAIEQIEQGSQSLQTAEQIYTTAYKTMNQVIAAYNLAYQMSRMPQDLAARYQSDFSMWTNFSSASVPNTYGNTSAWINALDLGNPTRATSAYNASVIQLQSYPSSAMSSQDATTQAFIQNQYASSQLGQATLTNSLSTLGTIRSDSQTFQQKLANLESDTYSTDPSQQTSNALLGKINTATLLQIHSQQDTNQILAAEVAQRALDEKEQLDERNRLINESIYFNQNFPNVMQQVTGGITDAIQSISLSPNGRLPMPTNYLSFLSQAMDQLLTTKSAVIQATGLDIFRGLAVILIAWFGIKSALSAAQGHGGGFHFAKFADLILLISFGFGMLTYYSTPIPGVGYSFSELITKEAIQLSAEIQSSNAQQIVDAVTAAEKQLGAPPGLFSPEEELNWLIAWLALAIMQAFVFAVIAYGYVASAVCVLIGPVFIPWFIVPKLDWLFWGWLKAFIGFSFYQVVASAFLYVFSQVVVGVFKVLGTLSLSNIVALLPALLTLVFVCVYGLHKIPELTASILGGRAGTWVNPTGK